MNSSNGPVSETGGERWTSTPADRNDRLRRTSTFRDGALDLWQRRSVAVIGAGVIGGRVGPEIVRSGATVAVFDPGRGQTVPRPT